MKAATIHAPHDLRLDEIEPQTAGSGQVRVRITNGGICGSDLHYYHDGGFGTVRIKEPLILGHEVAGIVESIGAGVTRVRPGMTIAVNPSRPCNACVFCLRGEQQHCLDMRFYGSAMRFPHVQGGFRESLVCEEAQAVPTDAAPEIAAFAEPLAVCLHAVNQAGSLHGARVLITGCGPIGALLLLAARNAGAAYVAVTDIQDAPLEMAMRLGAHAAYNTGRNAEALAAEAQDKGRFDVTFEASGNARALAAAITVTRPRGTIVQVGIGGAEMPVAMNTVVAKELTLRGTFRFHVEFARAVELLASGRINVAPLLTEIVPLAEAVRAFTLASDRSKAMKVQLGF